MVLDNPFAVYGPGDDNYGRGWGNDEHFEEIKEVLGNKSREVAVKPPLGDIRIMTPPLIYVSGKYTNGCIAKNIDDAEAVAVQLMRNGFDVICPHKNTAFYEKYEDIPYEKYIEMDLNILKRCDVIYMMSNWEESKGAGIERDYAIEHNIPVVYQDEVPAEIFTFGGN